MSYPKLQSKKEIAAGVVNTVPADLRKALTADKAALVLWEDITPLARNERICWVEDAEKPETRRSRIERVFEGIMLQIRVLFQCRNPRITDFH